MTDFERYAELYSDELTRFCLRLCGNVHDAEDLFQDTWTKALYSFDGYDPDRSFKTWLYTICVNTYRNCGKQKYNSAKVVFATAEEKERFFGALAEEERDLDAYIDLHSALCELPKKYRVVVGLFYFKAFTTKEIARMLGIPEGTVSSRLNKAKKLLKGRLSDE